jgi:thioredoxin-like negative regulator of GroEL
LLIALLGLGGLWLAWQGIKIGLRRSIQVAPDMLSHSQRPTLLYFRSDACAPCRWQQSPILDSLRQNMGESVSFREFDAVADPEMARRFRVLTVPTTVIIAPNGKVVAVNHGVTQAGKLQHQLANAATRA